MSEKQHEKVLTVKEVATILQVSEGTVRKLVNSGQLQSKRVGVQIRVTQASLDAYLKGDDDN